MEDSKSDFARTLVWSNDRKRVLSGNYISADMMEDFYCARNETAQRAAPPRPPTINKNSVYSLLPRAMYRSNLDTGQATFDSYDEYPWDRPNSSTGVLPVDSGLSVTQFPFSLGNLVV